MEGSPEPINKPVRRARSLSCKMKPQIPLTAKRRSSCSDLYGMQVLDDYLLKIRRDKKYAESLSQSTMYKFGRIVSKGTKCLFDFALFNGQGGSLEFPKTQLRHLEKLGSPESFFIPTRDGEILNARFVKGNGKELTVVIFTGMASSLEGMVNVARWYCENAKVNVLMFSRRGYGLSSGNARRAGEIGTFYDVQAVISYLVAVKHIPMRQILLHGLSLGAAYAVTGGLYFPLGGIVIDRPFASISTIGKKNLKLKSVAFREGALSVLCPRGIMLPDIPLFTQDHYISLQRIQEKRLKLQCPLQFHSRFIDPVIPFVTDGYDTESKLKSYMATDKIFYFYGHKDGFIKIKHRNIILDALEKRGTSSEHIGGLPISHTQFFLQNDTGENSKRLLVFISNI